MYDSPNVAGVAAPVLTTGAVAVLPNTGAGDLVQISIAVGAALVAWGVVYMFQMRQSA